MRWIGLIFAGVNLLDAGAGALIRIRMATVPDVVTPGLMLNAQIFLSLLNTATYCLAVFAQRSSTRILTIFLYSMMYLGAGAMQLRAIWSSGEPSNHLFPSLSAILAIGIGLGIMTFNASARAIALAFALIQMALMLIAILFLGTNPAQVSIAILINPFAVIWFLSLPWVREQFGAATA